MSSIRKIESIESGLTIVDVTDPTKRLQFDASGISTATTITLTVPDSNVTLSGSDNVETLTNKTLDSPIIQNNITFDEATNDLVFAVADQTVASPTITVPDLAGTSGDVVITNATQTLTNKTLTTPIISTISNTGTLTLPTATDTLVGRQTTDTLTNKTISDASNTVGANELRTTGASVVIDTAAPPTTGQVLKATSATTATWQNDEGGGEDLAATLAIGNTTGGSDIVMSGASDTINFTRTNNLIIDSATIATADRTITFPDPGANDSIAYLDLAQTLTNKTLTAPIISTISNTGTLTLPTATDTLVGRQTTDTLTNKTISDASNTVGANELRTTGASVVIDTAAPPSTGQVLKATSATTATWQNDDGGEDLAATLAIGNVTGGSDIVMSGASDTINFTRTNNLIIDSATIATADRTITFPDPGANDSVVYLDLAQTLTNKNLTTPIVTGSILDANNNELLNLTATTSAVNEITLANGATGNDPILSATGDDANVGINFQSKGTGAINFLGNSTGQALVRLYEDTDNGNNYIQISGPSAISSNRAHLIPDTPNDIFTMNVATQTLTNKTISDASNTVGANELRTTGASVVIDTAAPPSTGQVLKATSATTATWQNDEGGGEDLAATLAIGNTTGGSNIVMSGASDTINFTRTNNLIIDSATIATADRTVTFPDPGANDSVTYLDLAQTLTNKTLTTPIISTISNTGTLTLPTATDTLVGRQTTDTLTNKTISDASNTVGANELRTTGASVVIDTAAPPSTGQVLKATSATTATWQDDDGGEDLAATLAIGNTSGGSDIVMSGASDTINFTRTNNLIIDSATIATADRTVTFPDPGANDSVTYLDLAQTLTNKTLTTPIISTISNTGTVTLPTATDTLVGRQTTDTLTNKTISDASNTVGANELRTTGAPVVIDTAAPPSTGQVLKATSATTATWQDDEGGGEDLAATLAIGNTSGGSDIVMSGASDTINFTRTNNLIIDSATIATADRTVTFPDPGANDSVVYLDLAQTLTNKTLSTGSTWSGNTITVANGGTGATTFTSGNFLQGNGTGAVTATKVVPTGVVVGTTDTQTLTNKTLTSPRIGTNILDTNGNELLLLTATGSAVNELTLANAATGTNPTITASGNDTNIGINLQTKGTGTVEISSASATDSGIIRLLDNTGGEYGAITVPDAVTTSYTLQLPDGVGTNGQFLRTDGNNPATLTWAAPAGGGDVIGPGSSTDNAIVRWNGASGTSIQDSNVLISDTDSMTGLVNVGMSGDILDANGNELINLVTTASAVNEISITNAATGTNPIIGATGGDTNISLEYLAKGTGVHIFDNDTAAAEIRLQDNAGTDYIGIRPAATTTSYTLTMPPAQGGSGQVLQNNGAGVLSWASAGGTIANNIATSTVDTSTTSTTYVVMNSMTITPGAGTYLVLFSTSGDISGNNLTSNYAIFNNGTIVQHSERDYASAGGQTAGLKDALTTQSIETVAGGQAIDVRYLVSGGSITIHERSLILIKLA